ncbi:hypothetical protein DICPUDRAFT_25383 [Dictyostelium purpureum]|uniref:non-specific serine/threonine protein kinase n=1 Tax=Dictyostelium purpureum TaxID=5786 RepID=F0Z710_DICPU|nr:uncharacterized protein DICPUDRAFT_25383 [Dictyostelium purpureum]EGC40296.1 hypothetical protein DICPUDRAFT_25383 [Dictyostelium purpureum]|eukprot:XP_003283232.1 hypothetical protein DICPUDRAFT_25383 [Dictyostelium purpureum]
MLGDNSKLGDDLQNNTVTVYMSGGPTVCANCSGASNNHNYEYVDQYACKSQPEWNGGYISFQDPTPNSELVVVKKIRIEFTSLYQYEAPGGTVLIIIINDADTIDVFEVAVNSTSFGCPNCQLDNVPEIQPTSFINGVPSYKYQQENSLFFNFVNPNISTCVGKISITIFYGAVGYKVSQVSPFLGPSTGGTSVTIVGTKFYNSNSILCKFGSQTTIGSFVNETAITCLTPPINSTNPKDFNVTVQISEDGGSSYCAPLANITFTYTLEPLPIIHPPIDYQKLIWIIIGVSIAVLIVIAIGIFFIVRLRNKNRKLNGSRHKLPIGGNDDERSPLLKTDYKTLFEIKPIDISEILVQNRIGRGSCAEVYTGTWRGITVAIKKAKLLNEDDQDFLNELAQEATIMSQLRHPNICQFLGTCNNPPEILIVMEYMPLGSLYRILHDPTVQLDWPRMKSMALDIAKGMNYLHCCDPIVIHRDLKSHNLLVDEHFRVKISDFGLSTRFKKHLDKKTAMTPVGTPCWTAPEVLRNDAYTEKADVFSFAIVLWEIVTREDPYQGMPTFQIVISVGQHKLRPIVPPQVSAPFTRLITECWSEDPQQRPSFQEIVKRLEAM